MQISYERPKQGGGKSVVFYAVVLFVLLMMEKTVEDVQSKIVVRTKEEPKSIHIHDLKKF